MSQKIEFSLINRMPIYPLSEIVASMQNLRRKGADVINLGMGNPDGASPDFVVDKLCESAQKSKNHRYSVSKGIFKLRQAICSWYQRKYDVALDADEETVATMGAKEGLSHLIFATSQPGDVLLAPNPTYPIHYFAPILARANVRDIDLRDMNLYFQKLEKAIKTVHPKPKFLICCFPSNPTTDVVDLEFFKDLVAFCKKNDLYIIHDLAYADLCFDGYKAPSLLQVNGAKDIAVELYSMSKGYNMPGWRVAFTSGNKDMVKALTKIKSYLDYGMFQPIQIAATVCLNEGDEFAKKNSDIHQKRRDLFIEELAKIGWQVKKPKATMFIWAKIPEQFGHLNSVEFATEMLFKANVCVAPGIGFGEFGEGYVRFAMIENDKRLKQAVKNIKKWFNE